MNLAGGRTPMGSRPSRWRALALVAGTSMLLVAQLLPATMVRADDASPAIPAATPTAVPADPTAAPTDEPTAAPTEEPTAAPTEAPTEAPTAAPTDEPTAAPTEEPTAAPTGEPTAAPTGEPTPVATDEPTEAPTETPTETPTEIPSVDPAPSDAVPSDLPSLDPSAPPVGAEALPQTITFDNTVSGVRVGDTGVSLTATASTAVTYGSSTTDVCTINPATGALAFLAVGTCTITADAVADETYDAASTWTSFDVWEAVRECRSYTGESFVGSVLLNADGTPIGCGTTAPEGAPADLKPDNWDATWAGSFGDPGWPRIYTERYGWACDDCWIGATGEDSETGLPIGFDINYFGTTYSTVFVNSNGSIAFGNGSSTYDEPLDVILDGAAGVVAYGLDLFNGYPESSNRGVTDTGFTFGTGRHEDFFYWGRTTFNGHQAFVATWMNMGPCCDDDPTQLGTFQIVLVDVDGGAGTDVDVMVNYGSLEATDQGYSCEDNSGSDCVAIGIGSVIEGNVQYASIVDDAGVLYNGRHGTDVADDGDHPLREAHLHSNVPGRFIFQMRGGEVPEQATEPGAPEITSTTKGDTQGDVAWDAPADTGNSPISGYVVRWRIAGTEDEWLSDTPSTSPYTITGLTNDTTYSVQVAAVNGVGQGPWSDPASLTPGAEGSPDWTDIVTCTFRVGVACSNGVSASGEPAPTYAVTDGELPAGITLDPDTGALTGTPTEAGPYSFTITASNDNGSASWTFSGEVLAAAAPSPTPRRTAQPTASPELDLPATDAMGTTSGSRPLSGMLVVLGIMLIGFALVTTPVRRKA
jgi:hypothetical protein